MGDHGFLRRFLAERGPGVHHVTFKVPSLDEVSARAERAGCDVVGRDDTDPEWKEGFLHPKQALGIVVQFAESAGGDDGPQRALAAAPGPPRPARAGDHCGYACAPHSRERARRQWETVLEGHPSEGPEGELIYGWPGSPMRLAVEIDPARDEGPVAIELASDRAIALPMVRTRLWAPSSGGSGFSRVKAMKMWPGRRGGVGSVAPRWVGHGRRSSTTPSRT